MSIYNEHLIERNYGTGENGYFRDFHLKVGPYCPMTDIDGVDYDIVDKYGRWVEIEDMTEDNIAIRALISYTPFSSSTNFEEVIKGKKKSLLVYRKICVACHAALFHVFFNEKNRWIVYKIEKDVKPIFLAEFNDMGFITFIRGLHRRTE